MNADSSKKMEATRQQTAAGMNLGRKVAAGMNAGRQECRKASGRQEWNAGR
jgi:hypothetical protein